MFKSRYKFLDLSGYMFSGKAAAIDLVREFRGYHVPYYREEFPLIRIQDGLIDLEKGLLDDWSPIRSDVAIKRFIKLITKLANNEPRLSLDETELVGWRFKDIYGEMFYQYSMEYVNSLINLRLQTPWPYYEMAQSANEIIHAGLVQKIKSGHGEPYKLLFSFFEKIPLWIFPTKPRKVFSFLKSFSSSVLRNARTVAGNKKGWPEVDLFLSTGDDFLEKTQIYLEKVLSIPVVEPEVHTIVMHNGFEPFNPWRPLRYFNDAKCIVVDRDPRDIYVTSLTFSEGFNDIPEIYSKAVGADNIDSFIKRQKIYKKNTQFGKDPPGRILRLRFEELVCDYDQTLKTIYSFLGENQESHINKCKYFDPMKSRKNVGLWKEYPNQDEIDKIQAELKEYCYEI